MSTRKSRYISTNGMEMHFSEWGSENPETVVCVHGLTRNGRDFDAIAEELAVRFRVVCPDVMGRGLSQWSENPDADYRFDRYVSDLVHLVNSLEVDRVRWIGTSMGGALGIRLAGSALKGRISRLVLNDIGPGPMADSASATETLNAGIQRIVSYLSKPPRFRSLRELVSYYQGIYASFGIQSEEGWTHFTENSARRTEDGSFSPDYDPNIAVQMTRPAELELWETWNQIECPVFVLRGETSDILPSDVFARMKSGPVNCTGIEIAGCGHAPALNTPEQIEAIASFLTAGF
ncbi:alpha/beta hydrolase [Alicyclobacillus tolerans]|uniref:alpha/beta fold hydrolase n=1 Tax=Alicyclobacillus tolerans TaxID=90970 RepID=UPI001F3525E0|nr:alpha/beta hydrolase [Alicyclobacillus tolerans]MCF8565521.1 alpha/beta hydrolase [Alicyclobacillus tolerans]